MSEPQLITRGEAKAAGLKQYFTGEPCKFGHVAERYVACHGCTECRRIYRERNREILNECARIKREQTLDKSRANGRRYYAANRAKSRVWRGLPEPMRPEPTVCECCGGPPNAFGSLHLDHCHETGAFRGWLCGNCNTAIGKLGDDSIGLLHAISYLQWAESVTHPHVMPPGV